MCKLAVKAKRWKDVDFVIDKLVVMMRNEFAGADFTAV
jgi:hypothetical protein